MEGRLRARPGGSADNDVAVVAVVAATATFVAVCARSESILFIYLTGVLKIFTLGCRCDQSGSHILRPFDSLRVSRSAGVRASSMGTNK